MYRIVSLALIAVIIIAMAIAYGYPSVSPQNKPKKLLIYYGYPSLFNGSTTIQGATRLFDKYDIVVLGAGLESPEHPDHLNALKIIQRSRATFYGYVQSTLPLDEAKKRIDLWTDMGVAGIFLDEFGFDYLVGRVASNKQQARLHQKELIDYVKSKNMRVAINFWNPDDVFGPVGGVSLNLSGVEIVIESAVYGYGEKKWEYIDHYYKMASAAKAVNASTWCIVSTKASTSPLNKMIGYDALTYIYGGCGAVAIQEDYGEDSNVFYPFSEPSNASMYFLGVNVPLWGDFPKGWLENLLDQLKDIGFNSVQYTVYYEMDSPVSNSIHTSSVTVPDDQLGYAIDAARQRGFKVFLRIGLNVKNSWSGEVNPPNRGSWFKSYEAILLKYAEIAREKSVDAYIIGTELSMLQADPSWRTLILKVKTKYSGPISYSANWGHEATIFTDMLDFIGVDAYYPILNITSWDIVHETRIEPLVFLYGKPVVFLEIGYRSVENPGLQPWDWQRRGKPDQEAQARLWEIFFLKEARRINGFFYWDEGSWKEDETGYNVLGKLAEKVFRKYLPLLSIQQQLESKKRVNETELQAYKTFLQSCIENTTKYILDAEIYKSLYESSLQNCTYLQTRLSHVINDYMDTMETLLKLQAQHKELAAELSRTETALKYSIAINILLVLLLLFVSLLYIRSKRQNKNERAETSQEKAEQQLK